MITLENAERSNLTAIMDLIEEARIFLGKSGSDQWQGIYPARSDIEDDIAKAQAFVLKSDGQIAGYCAIITGEEPAYTGITEGNWSNDALDYVTVHRIAMSDKFRGQGLTHELWTAIFEKMAAQNYRDFRVDTHEKNEVMQHILEREGFVKRGMVIFDGPRIAYQKEL